MAYPDCKENTRKDGLSHERFCKIHSLIKVNRIPKNYNAPYFFHLPHITRLSEQNWRHEKLAADIFAVYKTTWSLNHWDALPDEEMVRLKIIPDRISKINDHILFWEIDRGSMDLGRLHLKVEGYIRLSKEHKEHRFNVIFVTETNGRADSILFDVLEPFKRGNQFLVGVHGSIVNDPFGNIFASPLDPEKALSIAALV